MRSNLFAVLLVTLIAAIGIALPYPILSPLFLDSDNPINRFASIDPYWLLGISLAIYPLGMLIGGNWLGQLSDRVGRKPVLFWTLLAAAGMNLLCAYSIQQSAFVLFFIARFVTGLLEGNIAVARAIITDLDESIDRVKAFSYVSAAVYLGWFIGPLIGGYSSAENFAVPFVIASAINIVGVAVIGVWLDETVTKCASKSDVEQSNPPRFWRTPQLLGYLLTLVALNIAVNIYYEFYPVYLVVGWQASPEVIANATIIVTLGMIFGATVLVPALGRVMSTEAIFVMGALLTGLSFVLFVVPQQLNWVLATFLVSGLAIAIYNAIVSAWFSRRFAALPQGKLMGALTSAFFIGNVFAALFGSYLARFNVVALLLIAAFLAVLSGLLFHWRSRREQAVPSPAN